MIAADDIAGAISALGGTKDSGSLLEIIIAKEEKDMVYITEDDRAEIKNPDGTYKFK
jgi:hypothetical protein